VPPQWLVAQLLVAYQWLFLCHFEFWDWPLFFGLLNIINFAHGAQYTMGAFIAWIDLT